MRRLRGPLVGLIIASLALSLTGCFFGSCPDPERIGIDFEDYMRIDDRNADQSRHHGAEEIYLRIISDSEVEITYERDDEIVVEIYEVSARDTDIQG